MLDCLSLHLLRVVSDYIITILMKSMRIFRKNLDKKANQSPAVRACIFDTYEENPIANTIEIYKLHTIFFCNE